MASRLLLWAALMTVAALCRSDSSMAAAVVRFSNTAPRRNAADGRIIAHAASVDDLEPGPTLSVRGDTVDVWAAVDQWKKCHIIDVPDVPAKLFLDDQNITHLVAGSTNFHVSLGTPLHQTRDCRVAWNMSGDPDPAMFAADEFLDGTHALDNGTVYALLDTEYVGQRYNNCAKNLSYPYCYQLSISLAVSHDWGLTWKHALPPPHNLVATVPYVYNMSHISYGWGAPSIVQSPSDGYIYMIMWNKHDIGLQKGGLSVARTAHINEPASWRGLDKSGEFTVSYVSPYTMAPGTESDHVSEIVNLPHNCAPHGLTYSTKLGKFVVSLCCYDSWQTENPRLHDGGGSSMATFLFATSPDMITWSETTRFFNTTSDLPANISAMVTGKMYPSLFDPKEAAARGDRNFGVIGAEPWLYWVSIGHSPYSDGRHLWATPVDFG